eukprot:2640504-Prymnesium_polylepis.2
MLPCSSTQGASQGRHGAVYTALVEVMCGAPAVGFTRGSSQMIITYYVNGTMIDVYQMDPHGFIPIGLKSPHIGKASHLSLLSKAFAERAPAVVAGTLNRPAAGVPSHADAGFVAGAVTLDDSLAICEPPLLWDGSPLPIAMAVREQDRRYYGTAAPRAFPAYERNFNWAPPQLVFPATLMGQGKMAIVADLAASAVGSTQSARLWRAPSFFATADPSILADLELPRERRSSFVLNREMILDERRTATLPKGAIASAAVLVCVPPMLELLQHEGLPLFVTNKTFGPDGLAPRPHVTLTDCLELTVEQYFGGRLVDEASLQRIFYGELRRALKANTAHYFELEIRLTLHEVLSLLGGGLKWEEDSDGVLVYDFSELSEAELLDYYCRLFGKRGIRLDRIGANNATFYKILMASNKRGCRELRWSLHEQARTATRAPARLPRAHLPACPPSTALATYYAITHSPTHSPSAPRSSG